MLPFVLSSSKLRAELAKGGRLKRCERKFIKENVDVHPTP